MAHTIHTSRFPVCRTTRIPLFKEHAHDVAVRLFDGKRFDSLVGKEVSNARILSRIISRTLFGIPLGLVCGFVGLPIREVFLFLFVSSVYVLFVQVLCFSLSFLGDQRVLDYLKALLSSGFR